MLDVAGLGLLVRQALATGPALRTAADFQPGPRAWGRVLFPGIGARPRGVTRVVSTRPVRFAELPGGQHAFDLFFSLRYGYVIEGVAAFCRSLRPDYRQ